jgi:hypothetical protein
MVLAMVVKHFISNTNPTNLISAFHYLHYRHALSAPLSFDYAEAHNFLFFELTYDTLFTSKSVGRPRTKLYIAENPCASLPIHSIANGREVSRIAKNTEISA